MEKPTSDFGMLEDMIMTEVVLHAAVQCVRLGLFETLEERWQTPAQVAGAHGFQVSVTESLLAMLAAHGLLEAGREGYRNSRISSEYLRPSSPFHQGEFLSYHSRFTAFIMAEFPALLRGDHAGWETVEAGWSSAETALGTAQYARQGGLQDTVAFIAGLPGFADLRGMCDLGGGLGDCALALLELNPSLRAEIIDLPHVAVMATAHAVERGLAHRFAATGGDLRNLQLSGGLYDLVLASHILYAFMPDLGPFFAAVHAALRPGGWFVAMHLDAQAGLPATYMTTMEFITRMAGYPTHAIPRKALEEALTVAGFGAIRADAGARNGSGLLLAARKD